MECQNVAFCVGVSECDECLLILGGAATVLTQMLCCV